MNIGFKPTLNKLEERTIEIHLFNYKNDLYGTILKTKVIQKIRNEFKFKSLEDLKKQIKIDNEKAERILMISNV
jgi:riboflavin kinase/FMN adenylyltransferase